MTILKCTALFILTAISGCNVFGQPAVKTYAFEQQSIPGNIPAGVTDENGNPINTSKAGHSTSFYIYLSHSNKSIITPVSLWINGRSYSFQTEHIKNTPVTKVNPNIPERATTTVLVPKTSNKVTRLLILNTSDKLSNTSSTEKKMLNTSSVVISYKWKGKIYYATAKELKRLEPTLHQ